MKKKINVLILVGSGFDIYSKLGLYFSLISHTRRGGGSEGRKKVERIGSPGMGSIFVVSFYRPSSSPVAHA